MEEAKKAAEAKKMEEAKKAAEAKKMEDEKKAAEAKKAAGKEGKAEEEVASKALSKPAPLPSLAPLGGSSGALVGRGLPPLGSGSQKLGSLSSKNLAPLKPPGSSGPSAEVKSPAAALKEWTNEGLEDDILEVFEHIPNIH